MPSLGRSSLRPWNTGAVMSACRTKRSWLKGEYLADKSTVLKFGPVSTLTLHRSRRSVKLGRQRIRHSDSVRRHKLFNNVGRRLYDSQPGLRTFIMVRPYESRTGRRAFPGRSAAPTFRRRPSGSRRRREIPASRRSSPSWPRPSRGSPWLCARGNGV